VLEFYRLKFAMFGAIIRFQCVTESFTVLLAVLALLHNEQLAQNWSGQEESDCLIKTKHCDGLDWC
jgi:hypothetical protein